MFSQIHSNWYTIGQQGWGWTQKESSGLQHLACDPFTWLNIVYSYIDSSRLPTCWIKLANLCNFPTKTSTTMRCSLSHVIQNSHIMYPCTRDSTISGTCNCQLKHLIWKNAWDIWPYSLLQIKTLISYTRTSVSLTTPPHPAPCIHN